MTAQFVVSAMYRFVHLDDFTELRSPLLAFLKKNNICGTLLLAQEGINGTVAGSREAIDSLYAYLRKDPRLEALTAKESYTDKAPFYRTKVKLKKEIVTLGVDGIDPNKSVGRYVKPKDWNQLISDPNTILIDTRNDYEVAIGTFQNALNPNTETFREFPEYVTRELSEHKDKNIAMFCTGGIRCEKSTALLRGMGFENVFHLEGGILKYLEEVPKEETMWEGECFVFDNRVAVNHDLEPGQYDQCYACRRPITEEDKRSEQYSKGVSCPHCYDSWSEEDLARFRERERQVELARERGEHHIGSDVQSRIEARREEKSQRKKKQRELSS